MESRKVFFYIFTINTIDFISTITCLCEITSEINVLHVRGQEWRLGLPKIPPLCLSIIGLMENTGLFIEEF